MLEIIGQIIPIVTPAAWPLIIVILGCCAIYLKIGKDRKQTKEERDNQKDELDKRLTLVEHDVKFMKDAYSIFAGKLDKILDELTAIKIRLATKADIKQTRDD